MTKEFSLVAFDYKEIPNYENYTFYTSLNAQDKWNYYINDLLMPYEARALVSTLFPQAIESIEFIPADTLIPLYAQMNLPAGALPPKSRGSARFYTRDISKSVINDSTTVYILNDDQVITRKIYEAINPVFIRSLKRITDPEELSKYGYINKIKEIVKIDIFVFHEVVPLVVLIDECPGTKVYLVDNIPLDYFMIYKILNKLHFDEICTIGDDQKKAFAPYRKQFPKKKAFAPYKKVFTKKKPACSIRRITIITLLTSTKPFLTIFICMIISI